MASVFQENRDNSLRSLELLPYCYLSFTLFDIEFIFALLIACISLPYHILFCKACQYIYEILPFINHLIISVVNSLSNAATQATILYHCSAPVHKINCTMS